MSVPSRVLGVAVSTLLASCGGITGSDDQRDHADSTGGSVDALPDATGGHPPTATATGGQASNVRGGSGTGGTSSASAGALAEGGADRLPLKCPPGRDLCDGECVDLTSDSNHCGACGQYCGPTPGCFGPDCPDGCVAPQQGACLGRSCVRDCSPGLSVCAMSCVDLCTSSHHCGGCDQPCPDGQVCNDGVCGCPAGYTLCSGECVDTTSDPNHCGGCGIACPEPAGCDGGWCFIDCPAGSTLCGDECVDLTSDPNNCGACGVACPGMDTCSVGVSLIGCNICNGTCVDVATDPAHCGDGPADPWS